MSLPIPLEPESEARLRDEAVQIGVTPEELTARRLLEADLLWRIRTAAPEDEERLLHRLLRRRNAQALTGEEQAQLQALLDEREQRGAQRLRDLGLLSKLRAIPVQERMR